MNTMYPRLKDEENWAARADQANRAARFLAQTTDDERPMIEVAGIQVYVYLDPEWPGILHLTTDFETADPELSTNEFTLAVHGGRLLVDAEKEAREQANR